MKKWIEYQKERLGVETIYNEHGYISYKIYDKAMAISDTYLNDYGVHSAVDLYEKLKKIWEDADCSFIQRQLDSDMKDLDCQIKMYHRFGFKVMGFKDDKLIMSKEV